MQEGKMPTLAASHDFCLKKRIDNELVLDLLEIHAVKKMKNSGASIRVLDRDGLKLLSGESNSSKFAIDAHNRGIEEIGDLSELPKLVSLDVSFNCLRSLQNLHTAKELRELKIYNNMLTSTHGLKANPSLEGLMLHENQIDVLSPDFLGLGRLKTLWLNGNRLVSISNLNNCRQLVHLDLARNQLCGAVSEGLESLNSLEYLNMSNNQLTTIGNLSTLTKLEELVLSNNQLKNLSGQLPEHLVVLRLNGNHITDISSLKTPLPNLTELYLHDNNIKDATPLANACPRLESLDIRNNAVDRVNGVLQLAKCASLQDLWVQGNPFCQSDSYLLEITSTLPDLKTLDAMSDIQLQQLSERLQSGAISQDTALALASSRPTTPSSLRPGTPLSRPGSSSGSKTRQMTPTTRPGTPETTAPVFHQPSARIGTLLKLPDQSEILRKHDEVSERLRAMKAMLERVGTLESKVLVSVKGDTKARRKSEKRTMNKMLTGETKQDNASIHMERRRSLGPETDMIPPSCTQQPSKKAEGSSREQNGCSRAGKSVNKSPQQETATVKPTVAYPSKDAAHSVGVDAGTDPMDSFMGSVTRTISARSLPLPYAPNSHCEMETQTQSSEVPPAAPTVAIHFERDNSDEVSQRKEHDFQDDAPWEPEHDGAMLEKQMKTFLQEQAASSDPASECNDGRENNQYETEGQQDRALTDSPRFDPLKSAELRQPPTARSRQGYRAFRVPTRTISPNVAG